jgi:hypothetical protein
MIDYKVLKSSIRLYEKFGKLRAIEICEEFIEECKNMPDEEYWVNVKVEIEKLI